MTNLSQDWVHKSLKLSAQPADFYSGCRKILRRQFPLQFRSFDSSLKLADCGYTKSKMTMLTKNYLHEESQQIAVTLWNFRRSQAKYGSVSFTTFNHFVKRHDTAEEAIAARGKRASVFGPCIQSVSITWLTKTTAAIDVHYRTTEFFKKFPADLVFIRDVLLAPFDFDGMSYTVNFHFANVTLHPMYFITIVPLINDPINELEKLKASDLFFYNWVLKWTCRYISAKHARGIDKFAQALRVKKDALERVPNIDRLARYMELNHPGHRNEYIDPDEEEE